MRRVTLVGVWPLAVFGSFALPYCGKKSALACTRTSAAEKHVHTRACLQKEWLKNPPSRRFQTRLLSFLSAASLALSEHYC